MSGKLYIVGTPIGNLGDISPRAAQVLAEADFIAAEDTRNSLKLLDRIGVRKEMISYFEHNKASRGEVILSRISSGETCALVTDAGMPAVSDPGEDIVRACHEHGIEVVVIPGPCAAVCALALSGLPSGRFCFEGFLPPVAGEKRRRLAALTQEERTMIFYEAPHRLSRTLRDLYDAFGDRRVSVVKEITKIHECAEYTTLSAASVKYAECEIRGEFVLVVEGASDAKKPPDDAEVSAALSALTAQGVSRSEAVKRICAEKKLPKNYVYRLANTIE